jgi:predicted Fe-Mo cluster-binding NifX family protein
MSVAVSADTDSLDGHVHNQFGRCACFLIVQPDSLEWKAIENPYRDAPVGAGSGCGQLLLQEGIEAVIAGRVGPTAHEVLTKAGIGIFLAPENPTVKDALERYKKNQLQRMVFKVF